MALKGVASAGRQVRTASGAVARKPHAMSSVPAARRPAAFQPARRAMPRMAAAEEGGAPAPAAKRAPRTKREVTVDLNTVSPGDEFDGSVTAVEGYGAFVNFGAEKDGLVHISQLANKVIKNIADTVSVGEAVKVRVLSVDAAAGKIALTMRSENEAGDMLADDGPEESSELLPADGHEFVYADAVADFEYPFQMREDAAMTIADVNEFEDAELEAELTFDLPLPLNELVKGTVTRVEDFGAFMTVSAGGRELKAFLERDEAKVLSAGLSAEQLAGYGVQAGDVVPEYLDAEMDSMKEAYKVGDVVTAFVLDFTDRGELNVTQYTDAEVEADGFDIEEDDNNQEDDEEPLSVMGTEGYDVLAMEPEDLLDEDDDKSRGPVGDDGGELSAAAQDYKVFGRGTPLSGSLYSKSGMTMPAVSFPDRPLDKLDANAINNLSNVDTDFDGDEIYLEELWQESIPVPKSALRKLGLKAEISEDGQVEIVEREGAEVVDENVLVALQGDLEARAAAFVEDLLEDDEDEAELPAYAMRQPLTL